MNVLVVPRISSSPLSPPPPPLISSRVFSTRVFIAFFRRGVDQSSVADRFRFRNPYPHLYITGRFDETGKDKLELLCRGKRGEKTGLLISVSFKAERQGGGKKRSPKGFQIARFSRLCPWKTVSILSPPPCLLLLSLCLFSSLLETHHKLSSPPFPSRDSSDSRPRRFQSCLVEVSTRSHLPLDIPEQPAPLSCSLSPSHTAAKRLKREEENGRCLYIDRSGRIECRLEGNSRSLPQEIRGTRDPFAPLFPIPSLFFCFSFLFFPSLPLPPKIRLL